MQGSRALNLGLRAFQFIMVFLVLVLVGNMIASTGSGPSIINYDLFAAIFAMLSLIYLIAATFSEGLGFAPVLLGLDIANTIWLFIGAVATAAYLHTGSCGDQGYMDGNRVIRGSSKRCKESKASTVFLFLAFFTFLVSAVLTGLGTRGQVNMRSRSSATMSQVTV